MHTATQSAPQDFMDPQALKDPESYFGKLREEDPIHWNEKRQMWLVTDYDTVVWVARQPDLFSSDKLGFNVLQIPEDQREDYKRQYPAIFHAYPRWLSATDNPMHDHLRLIVNQVWTPSQAEKRRVKIRGFINDLLDDLERKDSIDFIRDFTMPLPIKVILDFLDLPHQDWEIIKHYSDLWLTYHFGGGIDPQRWQSGQDGIEGLMNYVKPRIKERMANRRNDYISALLDANWKGDRLSEDEVIVHCANLLFSGHETTTNLLANGLYLLLRHRDQWERLRREPNLAPTLMEEVMRMESAVKSMLRYAMQDVEVKGKKIKKGDLVLLIVAAAGRDAAKFSCPHTVDIGRRPNAHVGFGQGIHICLGAPLVRVEVQETFLALSQRFPNVQLAKEDLEYHPMVRGRALKELPITLK